ncbi:group III truncated hemoglobin [Fibrella aquatilis]|uniref:Group III truncated hemoglobin n=1 Tax=Fibrella aquatilis TaxID=2817059 RepID=A0A939G6B9_9BACT|nr:group III truncated hemoglobin [Fibrella aquatilis]MBO0931835.1 group III truncated hemoglobin [Fibrella aquatilis]
MVNQIALKLTQSHTDITTRADIENLVETFYDQVFADKLLAPLFTVVAHVTLATHFPLMADFWETILFAKNRYHSNVILKHIELHSKQLLEPVHFEQWNSLFCLTVNALFTRPIAEAAKTRARTMSMVLQAKLHTLANTH